MTTPVLVLVLGWGVESRGRRTVANMRAWSGNRVQRNNSTPPLPEGKKVGSAPAMTAPTYRGGKPGPAHGLEMDVETTRNPTLATWLAWLCEAASQSARRVPSGRPLLSIPPDLARNVVTFPRAAYWVRGNTGASVCRPLY
jgi:hypothetical protein